jgi:probable F420-dependent oxidoreductase
MQIGVVFPQTEFPSDSDPLAIRDFAQAAEDLGYQHLLAYDHLLGANPNREGGWSGPYTYTDPFQEPLLLFSYLAGLTEHLSFITGIIILPQRETVLFAKQAATLDVLCQGRLRLGIGLGWNKVEYIAQNKDFHNRGARIEEQVQVLRKLWTEELVTFEGPLAHHPGCRVEPAPLSSGRSRCGLAGMLTRFCAVSPELEMAGCPTTAQPKMLQKPWQSCRPMPGKPGGT